MLANISDKTALERGEALLTGGWVSTLPFLQGHVIDGDVALDARAPDAFQHHLSVKTSLPS